MLIIRSDRVTGKDVITVSAIVQDWLLLTKIIFEVKHMISFRNIMYFVQKDLNRTPVCVELERTDWNTV